MSKSAKFLLIVPLAVAGYLLLNHSRAVQPATKLPVTRAERAAGLINLKQVPVRVAGDGRDTRGTSKQVPSAGAPVKAGEAAFRAYSDAFFDTNLDEAKVHAEKEGLSLAEARELTYFGLLAMQTMRWEQVQELLGTPLSREKQQLAGEVMYSHSEDMKLAVKELNRTKASASERADKIARIERSYLQEYFNTTGMTPPLLDHLLANGAVAKDLADR